MRKRWCQYDLGKLAASTLGREMHTVPILYITLAWEGRCWAWNGWCLQGVKICPCWGECLFLWSPQGLRVKGLGLPKEGLHTAHCAYPRLFCTHIFLKKKTELRCSGSGLLNKHRNFIQTWCVSYKINHPFIKHFTTQQLLRILCNPLHAFILLITLPRVKYHHF